MILILIFAEALALYGLIGAPPVLHLAPALRQSTASQAARQAACQPCHEAFTLSQPQLLGRPVYLVSLGG